MFDEHVFLFVPPRIGISYKYEKLIRSIFEPYKAAELYICRNISGKRPDEKQTESDRLQDISEVLPAEAVRKS